MTKTFTSFKDAYDTLSGVAQSMREQEEPNIDQITENVQTAVLAREYCNERLTAVEAVIEEALNKGRAK